MDQIIRRAQLPDRLAGQLVDIGKSGSIVVIDPCLSADAASYDAAGQVACGGLIESHIHLDKARLPDVVLAPIDRQVNPV
jgi:cytosine deaminase